MDVLIRQAKPDEYFAIAKIWDASWRSTGVESPERLTLSELADRLRDEVSKGADLFAIEQSGEICGLVLIHAQKRQLSQLFLSPSAQGHGLGAQCLAFTKAQLPGGFWLTVAASNHRARHFYARAGLTERETFYRPEYKRDDVRYEWTP